MHSGCEELTLPSGVNAVYSDLPGSTRGILSVNSTVTQTCDAENNFLASGSSDTDIRMCTPQGWSGVDIACER